MGVILLGLFPGVSLKLYVSVCQQKCNYISWRLSWEAEGDTRSVFSFPFVVRYFKQLRLLDYTCSERGLHQLILEVLPAAAID